LKGVVRYVSFQTDGGTGIPAALKEKTYREKGRIVLQKQNLLMQLRMAPKSPKQQPERLLMFISKH